MPTEEIRRLERKVDDLTELAQGGFSKLDERVKLIELKQARQEGKESVMTGSRVNWQPVLLALAKALGLAIGLAYLLVEALLK